MALAVASSAAPAETDGPAYYDLAFTVEHGGDLVGNPRLLVEPGDTAEIRVEPDSGRGGYRLQVVAQPADGGAALDVQFYRFSHGGWYPAFETTARVETGVPALLTGAEGAAEKLPGLSVQVTMTPLSRADLVRLRDKWRSRGER